MPFGGDEDTAAHAASERERPDFASIYAAQKHFIWATLQRMGVPAADLEDVFQEVFVVAHRRLHTYRADAKLSAWLYGICRRSVAQHRRRASHRWEIAGRVDVDTAFSEGRPETPPNVGVSSPEELLARAQQAAELEELLQQLSFDQRVVLVMFEVEEQSCAQIAEQIGVPVGTVHSRLFKARQKLARAIERRAARPSRIQ